MPLKPATRRMLCALAGSFISLGAANPACGKPGFPDIISVVPQPFWTTLKLFRTEPKVSLILLAPSFVRQTQPDYAAANGVDFSALAGFNDNSNDGFAPIVVVDQKTARATAPANVDPANGHKSLGSSGPNLANNWSQIAGVGSTIPSYGTGFGAVSDNSSAAPEGEQSQLTGSDIRQGDRKASESNATVTEAGTQSAPLAGPDRGSRSLRDGSTVSVGSITLANDASKAGTIQHLTPKALVVGVPDAPDASAQWNGTTNSTWSTITNWSAGGPPGTGETATFNNAGNGNTTISLNNITINLVLFDTSSAAAYTMGTGGAGSQTLNLNNSGAITVNSTVTNNELFNAKLMLGNGTNVATSFAFTNDSPSGTLTFAGAIDTNPGNGNHPTWTLNLAGSGNGTISGAISGTGAGGNGSGAQALVSITKSGAGTWTLSGANTYAGGTNINGGILSLGSSAALGSSGTISFGGGTLQYSASNTTDYSGRFSNAASQAYSVDTNSQNVTFGSVLTSSGGTFTKLGAGTLTFNAANTYAGLTTVTAGTLAEGVNNAIGGGALTVNGATAIFDLGASHTDSVGTVTLDGGGAINGTGASALTSTGTFEMKSGTVNAILAGSAIALNKTTSGTVTLNGLNTYTGLTTITAGTLREGVSNAISTGSVTVNGATAVFDLGASHSDTVGTVTVAAGGSITGTGTSTLTSTGSFAMQSGSVTAIFAGSGIALNKTTTGMVTLSGANTYTGATMVNAGTLLVNGSTASGSTVTVSNSGTILGGTGTIAGGVTVNGNAILQGGNGTTGTTFTLSGALTLADNSIIQLALGPSGAHSTLARTGSGTWTFDSNQAFNFTNVQSGTYDNIITGLAANPGMTADWIVLNSGWNGTFTFDGMGGVDLTLTAVPEPGTWSAGALALLAVGWTQRRRFKSATVFASAA